MPRSLFTLVLAGVSVTSWCQLEVPHSLVLDGPQNADRQVTGLGTPANNTDGASVNADRNNTTSFAPTSGTTSLIASLTPALTAYAPGLRITLLPANANDGDATLNVNGLGAIPLRKNINMPLDSGDLRPGLPLQVIYDGTVFQVVDQIYPGCPSGFTPVSADVCIQLTPNDTLTWYGAVNYCANRGARLCGFQDWLQGCLRVPGFATTIVDYEWVDSAANSLNYAKLLGWANGSTEGDCTKGSRQVPQAKFHSRCCYDR
jgi:hypothetical protein